MYACRSGFDIEKADWKPVRGFPFVEYCVEKKGEETGSSPRIQLRFYGFQTEGKLVEDSTTQFPLFALNYLGQQLQKEAAFKEMPVNSIGYIRVRSTDIMALAQPFHFQLFYKNDPGPDMLNRDSLLLDSMQVFSGINTIGKDEAAALFEADNDADWKDLLDENPFPAMIELQLKSEFTRRSSVDSVKELLHRHFPGYSVEQLIKDYLPEGIDPRKAMPVFKFVVL